MNVREYLRTRRQRKARRLYEQEKARRDAAERDPDAWKRMGAVGMGGGGMSGGGDGGGGG